VAVAIPLAMTVTGQSQRRETAHGEQGDDGGR